MKNLLIKIPAMIAMLISLFSFYTLIDSLIASTNGESNSSDIWILAVIWAVLSMIFYFVDAILSIVKAVKKRDTVFNFILAAVILVGIPMLVLVGGSGATVNLVVWNVYYLAIFALEALSIVKIVKANGKK